MEFRGGRTGGGKLRVIGREPKRTRRARRLGLGMERLEDRVVLSTVVQWSGADALSTGNTNWSDAKNWSGNVAPVTGDSVLFPTGLTGAAQTSVDDISGLSLAGLTIAEQNYSISAAANVTLALTAPLDASLTSGSSTFNVPVNFGGSAGTLTVDNQAAALAMGGVITGTGGVTKAGNGVLDLKGANTYSGGTTVAAGALLVDGSVGDVTVNSGATLGGSGTVTSITSSTGTVAPGDAPTVTGILTDTGAYTTGSGGSFNVNINGIAAGTNYDQLSVGGAINLTNATLNVSTGSFTPVPGQQFTILKNTPSQPITGNFVGLAEGAMVVANGNDFTISYVGGSGHDVVLTAISPPTWTWTGTAAAGTTPDPNWSNPNNWTPSTAAPSAGYSLTFPSGRTGNELTSTNNINNTVFNSIAIQASGYNITGSGIGLAGTIDSSQATGNSTLGVPVTFNPGAGTAIVDNSGATLLMTGTVSATSGLVKQGQGTLGLEGTNTGLGATVDAGTLVVDGRAGNITANTGSTLGGTGTVSEITTVSATLSPGKSANSSTTMGVLTDTGGVVLSSTSTFATTLNGSGTTPGTDYDQLVAGASGATGTIDLANATLNLTIGTSFASAGGQQYTIIHNTSGQPITGTFSGLAEGGIVTAGGRSFAISYQGGTDKQDVVLTSLISTSTVLSPVTGSPVTGQPITLTATVAPSSGTGTPTGTVTFESGSTTLGTGTLNTSGVATLSTTKLNAGTNTLTAVYNGSTTYAVSTSAAVSVAIAQASTTTTLVSSANPALIGSAVTFTATVAPVSPGTGTPIGSVTFFNGSTQLGTANLAEGVGSYTTTSLPAGTSSITAVYSGDANYKVSTSAPLIQTIAAGAAQITVSASNPNPFALQPITLTAIVSAGSGLGTPTGSVTFSTASGTTLGTATVNNGTATLSAVNLPIGAQAITAAYSGNSSFLAADSKPIQVLVGGPTDLFVNQVYLDVLGVPASYSATSWIALVNGGYPPGIVAGQILQSQQARIAAVNGVYESILGRAATSTELVAALARGGRTTTPLDIKVFGSKEFYITQGKGTTDGFLNALAQDWFGAPFPAATHARLARELRRGVSRTQIARQVITSPSGVHAQVNTIFEAILQRPATAHDQARYDHYVTEGNLVSLYQALFASPEFKKKFT
ncbi:MAG: beta strand repeat-containing protein [Isosphaeraceae bacterium]